jgi:hypothetical protein
VLLLPPEWASRLAVDGWTRSAIGRHLGEHAFLPIERVQPHLRGHLHVESRATDHAGFGHAPDDFLLVVAGGIGIKAAYLPSWPGGSRAVTVPIG